MMHVLCFATDWGTSSLTYVDLSHNAISGTMPAAWSTNTIASHLITLKLGVNQITSSLGAGKWHASIQE